MSCPAIGIDLGTTNSVIAHINAAGRPVVILNAEGRSLTPSVISFASDPPVVGDEAKQRQAFGEENIAAFFKRSMGDSQFRLHLGGKDRDATDLSAIVLAKLIDDAQAALGEAITRAVITVPAYFNNAQREATIEAGRRAGLAEVLQIISEPTSAALAYRMDETGKPETLLVYDLGGGTFDVSLVHVTLEAITVLATAGDHNLGGKDWDDRIAAYLGEKFAEHRGFSPLDDRVGFNDILIRAENAKKALSVRDSVAVSVDHAGCRETFNLTRDSFQDVTRDLMKRTERLIEHVLADKKLGWPDVTGVLLVGGSSRMPMVREYVQRMSGKSPLTTVNVDEVVALGAAITAAKKLHDRGEVADRRFFLGAARRTRDVMSHSLGMIAVSPDGKRYINSILLPKNHPIPDRVSREYQIHTRSRGRGELDVYVTQGETEDPMSCSILGKYHFTDVPTGPRGVTVLDVCYAYDENGVVQVEASERGSGQKLPMTVEPVPEDMSWLKGSPEEQLARGHLTAYLAFDVSGSMSGEPLAEAKEAAREFIRRIDLSHNSVGVVSFADRVATNSEACQNAKQLQHAIDKMAVGLGCGNAATPFAYIHHLLGDTKGARFIIALTDGVWSCQDQAIREAKACSTDNIQIIAIGFGGADRDFLRKIATSEEDGFFSQCGKLVETFGTIAQELTESAGSPRRKRGLRFG